MSVPYWIIGCGIAFADGVIFQHFVPMMITSDDAATQVGGVMLAATCIGATIGSVILLWKAPWER